MKIVLLTRTSRPSGALVAKSLIENKKNLVAIIAEERAQLLNKRGSIYSILLESLKKHGFKFTADRLLESVNIKLHFFLRKILTSKIYRHHQYLSIEEFVLDHRIPYFVIKDHNSQASEGLIRSFAPDLIVFTNTRLIHKNIMGIPKSGCLNLHLSELPKYAGLNSIFWALFYGEKEIGVTVHFVSEELDRGDIVLQKKLNVSKQDTEKTLYLRAIDLGAEMMAEAVTQIEQNMVAPVRQDKRLASYFSWPTKGQRRLLSLKLKGCPAKSRKKGPLKVLHIITRLVKGGAQENTLLTVLGLKDRGYEVTLVSGPAAGPEGEIASCARKMGVNLIIIPELVRPINPYKDLVSFIKIFNLIKRGRFDIAHTHTSKAGIIGRCAAKLVGVPIIVHTPHGHIFYSYFTPLKTKFFRILEMIFSHFCDKVITLTDRCKEEHVGFRIASPEKFVTIHSGIKLEKFVHCSFGADQIKAELKIPPDTKVVGTVTRLEPIKGVGFFVEAMPEVLRKISQVYFLIVGDGNQRRFLEDRAKELGIAEKVTFTGIREDVARLISIMDIFVLPSLNEGMGRVLIEAGIMAKPVVASRVSGIPELVEDDSTGILFEPRDTKGLAEGIIQLLSDPQRAKWMGENARLRMKDNFSAERMVDKIDVLYRELIKQKGD